MIILLDAMGGDNAPDANIKGAVSAVNEVSAEILLIGKEDVLREEKIFNKIGLDLPFIVELSIKLNYYGLLDKICFSNSELVQSIWK